MSVEIKEVVKEEEVDKRKKKLWNPEVVTMLDAQNLTVGERKYRLVYNHREGFDKEALSERFSEVLSRYDYVVGDWGHDSLRLKGFFNQSHKKALPEQRIDTLEDYLYEFCNFGCKFFVLERIGGNHDKRAEREYLEEEQQESRKKRKKNYRSRQNQHHKSAHTEEKVGKVSHTHTQKQKPVFRKRKEQEQKEERQTTQKKRNFTIRQKSE